MKFLLVFLILGCFYFVGFSQTNDGFVNVEQKNTMTNYQRLDSLVYFDGASLVKDNKKEYYYTVNQRLEWIKNYDWQSTQWVLSTVDHYFLSEERVDSVHHFVNEPMSGSLIIVGRDLYFYNPEGQLTLNQFVKYDFANSLWYVNEENQYSYNSGGKVIEKIQKYYDSNVGALVNDNKRNFYYNALGNDTLEVYAQWQDVQMQWDNDTRIRKAYNANQMMISEETYSWNSLNLSWDGNYKYEHSFDSNDNLLTTIFKVWDVNVQWLNQSKDVYEYSSDTRIKSFYLTWNGTSWDSLSKSIYVYDGSYNLIKDVVMVYSSGSGTYDTTRITDYAFNTAYTLQSIIIPTCYDDNSIIYPYNSRLDEMHHYEQVSPGIYSSYFRQNYFYSTIVIDDVDELSENSVSIYPNPAYSQLNIKVDGLVLLGYRIYDIKGSQMLGQDAFFGTKIDIGALPQGLYYLQLYTDHGIFSKSLIINH